MRAAVEIWEVFRASKGDRVSRFAIVLEELDWKPIGLFYEDEARALDACAELGLEVVPRGAPLPERPDGGTT